MNSNNEAFQVWLDDAKQRAKPGTVAEKACRLLEVLYNAMEHVANCATCHECCIHTEHVLEQVEEIVEEL